jgi:hypothetical protein
VRACQRLGASRASAAIGEQVAAPSGILQRAQRRTVDPGQDTELRRLQLPADLLRRQEVAVEVDALAEPVAQVLDLSRGMQLVFDMEGQEKAAAGPQDPRELAEGARPLLRCEVDDRVKRYDAGPGRVLGWKPLQGPS